MEYDYSKLYGAIRESGYTQEEFAKKVGIGAVSLNKSLNNKRPFKQAEMFRIMSEIGKPISEVDTYFFCKPTLEI